MQGKDKFRLMQVLSIEFQVSCTK